MVDKNYNIKMDLDFIDLKKALEEIENSLKNDIIEEDDYCKFNVDNSDCEIHYGMADEEVNKTVDVEEDLVNHPTHYTNSGMECIDEMIMIFGEEAVMNFCLCNCWKYRKRALDKGGRIDLEKSDWYVAKYKDLKEIVQNKKISKHDKFVTDMRKLLADGASLHLDEPEFARLYKKLFPLD